MIVRKEFIPQGKNQLIYRRLFILRFGFIPQQFTYRMLINHAVLIFHPQFQKCILLLSHMDPILSMGRVTSHFLTIYKSDTPLRKFYHYPPDPAGKENITATIIQ